ncbi:MAG: calcium/sodium antiporter [Pseudomonadota bacterium]
MIDLSGLGLGAVDLGLSAAGVMAVLILGGLALLAFGGDAVVRGGVGLARVMRVSPVIIGVVLLGFGTSMPELVTSVQAALSGSEGIALGNVVGSNLSNLLLITGVAAAFFTAQVARVSILRDGFFMLASTSALIWLMFEDRIDRVTGGALLAALACYLVVAVATERKTEPDDQEAPASALVAGVLFLIGIAATVLGARFLVDGGVQLAATLGAEESLIGLTVIAVGTSLPELAATIAAALRGRSDLAIGNVIGSNVFNVCAIVGVTALIAPIPAPPELLTFDVWAMLAASVLMLAMAWAKGGLSRAEGLVLLLCYVLYLGVTIATSPWGGATL